MQTNDRHDTSSCSGKPLTLQGAGMLRRMLVAAFAFIAINFLCHASAWACANPSGVAGQMIYNADFSVMQFCDGSAWISMGGGGSDSDTLADLSCANDEIPKWNGSAWACAADDGGADTLAGLSCASGEVPEWDGSDWVCGTGSGGAGTTGPWADLTGSRAFGATYTNNTGGALAVAVTFRAASAGNAVMWCAVDGLNIANTSTNAPNNGYGDQQFFIVPAGSTYGCTAGGGAGATLYSWTEMPLAGGGGGVNGASPTYAFQVSKSTAFSTVNATLLVPFDVEDLDTDNVFDASSGVMKYQPTEPGQYYVSMTGSGLGCTSSTQLFIYKNGSQINTNVVAGAAGTSFALSIDTVVEMDGENDYLQAYLRENCASDVTQLKFKGFRIGGGSGSDTLAGLSCATNEIPKWNGSAWACAPDGNDGGASMTGAVMAFNASTCPTGWTEYTPARGRFLRGIDPSGSTTVDPDGTRAPGSTQADEIVSHTHGLDGRVEGIQSGASNSRQYVTYGANGTESDTNSKAAGGVETRPKNVAVIFCQYNGTGGLGGGSGIQVAFSVHKNGTSQALTTTPALLTWPTEAYDLGNNFAGNAFTAPAAGMYSFHAQTHCQYSTTYCQIQIHKNGAVVAEGYATGAGTVPNATAVLSLAANDTINVYASASGSGTQVAYGGAQYTHFEGYALGGSGGSGSDTLAGLSCATNEIPKWDGSAWACAADGGGTGVTPVATSSAITNQSTTSTTIVDMTGASVTFTSNGLPTLVMANFTTFSNTVNATGTFQIVIDGNVESTLTQQYVSGGDVKMTTLQVLKTLSAGSHTAKVRWMTNTGTLTANWNSGTTSIIVHEIGGGSGSGSDTLAGLSCASGEIPKWNGTAWACAADGGGSSQWTTTGSDVYYNTGGVTIGGTTVADNTSVLDLRSTTKGFLPPRMTTVQRDAITSPAEGLVVYNTTTKSLDLRVASSWLSFGGSMTGNTMVSGWPDAIKCTITTPAYADAYLIHGQTAGGSHYYHWPLQTQDVRIRYNSDGTFAAYHAGITTSNCNKSISQLYTDGQAFNFVGGGTASADGSAGQIQFNEGGNLKADAALHWDNTNKRLGIGTTAPGARLAIVPGTAAGTTIADKSISYGTLVTPVSGRSGFTVQGSNSWLTTDDNAAFGFVHPWSASNADAAYKVFRITTGTESGASDTPAASMTDRYYVRKDGGAYFGANVGIGTTAPNVGNTTRALTVSAAGAGENSAIELVGNRTTDAATGMLRFYNNSTEIARIYSERSGADTNGVLRFSTASSGVLSEWMRVTSAGNVGIGTSGPNGKLQIQSSTGNSTTFYEGGNNALFLNFYYGGANVGRIYTNGSSTIYQTTSDARLKENVVNSEAGLDLVEEIKVRDYNFKSHPGVTQQGFIAQELYEVYPQAVTVGGADAVKEPWGVEYGRLTPLLVKAIQELKADNDNLRAELKAANDNYDELRREIDALKAAR